MARIALLLIYRLPDAHYIRVSLQTDLARTYNDNSAEQGSPPPGCGTAVWLLQLNWH